MAQYYFWSDGSATWGWYPCTATAATVWASLGVPVRLAYDIHAAWKA